MKTVALLIFPGVQSLDVSGPMDVFAEANDYVGEGEGYRLLTVGTQPSPVRASNGQQLGFDFSLDQAGSDYDIVLVAGGPQLAQEEENPALSAWLRQVASSVPRWFDLHRRFFAGARRPARRQARHYPLERCGPVGSAIPAGAGRARPHPRARWGLGDVGWRDGWHRPGAGAGGGRPWSFGGPVGGQAPVGTCPAAGRSIAIQPLS